MVLALWVIGVGVVAGLVTYVIGRRQMADTDTSMRTVVGRALGLTGLFVVFGVGAGLLDADMRRTTLAEAILPGTLSSPAPAARTFDFSIEHPGVEHTLFVSPRGDSGVTPSFPVTLAIRLTGPDGTPIANERHVYEPERDMDEAADWPGFRIPFTPAATGTCQVTVTVATPGVPSVHVHISDPEKTDGERLPGY